MSIKSVHKRGFIFGSVVVLLGLLSIPELTHTNAGESQSLGSVRDGGLDNGWLLPYQGKNFSYFSLFSYYILDNAYVNHSVWHTVIDAYHTCETSCPGTEFVIMECTRKRGGRMLLHWTHQNGTSVDFMAPVLKPDLTPSFSSHAGLFHYLLQFDETGRLKLSGGSRIDFETMARHILAVDDAAKQHGLYIYKILFNTHMLDELYATPSGQEIQQRGIRIIPHVSDLVNRFHDDHYHIDFGFGKK